MWLWWEWLGARPVGRLYEVSGEAEISQGRARRVVGFGLCEPCGCPGDRPFNPCGGIARQASGELVTGAQIVYVNFDKATQSVRPVPEEIRRRIEALDGVSFTSPV